jgi:hypothetical protein
MPTPERLLPAYESLARLIRTILHEELAPIAEALAEIRAARDADAEPTAPRPGQRS